MRVLSFAPAFVLAATVPFLLAITASAQQPAATPTLDQLLTGVHNNFLAYLTSVPNLFAEEHVVSSLLTGYGATARTSVATTNSIFRMRRAGPSENTIDRVDPDGDRVNLVDLNGNTINLIESREAKRDTHHGEQQVNGPTVAVGLFSYGALDISSDLKRCYSYVLEPKSRQLRHTTVRVVDYTLNEPIDPNSKCPVTEPLSGKAFIDPATMHIVRVEQKRPKHGVYQGRLGLWSWSVDYGTVDLDGKPFWLPTIISAQSILDESPHAQWSFTATYRNYHLLTVHSTILPATAGPAQ